MQKLMDYIKCKNGRIFEVEVENVMVYNIFEMVHSSNKVFWRNTFTKKVT